MYQLHNRGVALSHKKFNGGPNYSRFQPKEPALLQYKRRTEQNLSSFYPPRAPLQRPAPDPDSWSCKLRFVPSHINFSALKRQQRAGGGTSCGEYLYRRRQKAFSADWSPFVFQHSTLQGAHDVTVSVPSYPPMHIYVVQNMGCAG